MESKFPHFSRPSSKGVLFCLLFGAGLPPLHGDCLGVVLVSVPRFVNNLCVYVHFFGRAMKLLQVALPFLNLATLLFESVVEYRDVRLYLERW